MTGPRATIDLTMSDDEADPWDLAAANDDDDICSLDTLPAPPDMNTEFEEEDYDRDTEPDLGRRSSCLGSASSTPTPTPRFDDTAKEVDVGEGVPGDLPLPPSFQFDKGTVRVRAIPADGHCLFRACLHQRRPKAGPRSRRRTSLPGDAEVHALRAQVAEYMRDNREELEHFFVNDGSTSGQTLDDSIRAVEEGDWGDSTCLSIVANLWKVPVEVYIEMGTVLKHFPGGAAAIGMSPQSKAVRPIRLAYRCVEEESVLVYNHYDSVEEIMWDEPRSSQATSLWPTTTVSSDVSSDASPDATSARTPLHPLPSAAVSPSSRTIDRRTGTPATPVRRRLSPVQGPPGPPAKRLCPEEHPAPADLSVSASLPSSQEMLDDRGSPTPGLMAPGSPDTECLSASQGTTTEKLSQDTVVSEVLHPPVDPRSPPSPGDADGHSALSRHSLVQESPQSRTTHTSMDRLLTEAPFSPSNLELEDFKEESSARTRQWVDEVVPAFEEDCSLDEGDFVLHVEPAAMLSDLDELSVTRDSATQVTTVGDSLYEWACFPVRTTNQKTMTPNSTSPELRTVSSNVRLLNGHLVGTFQVIYSKL